MKEFPVLQIIGSLISTGSLLLVLSTSIILVFKKVAVGSILMASGAALTIIFSLSSYILLPVAGWESAENLIRVQGILSVLTGISYLIFGIGLLLFALKFDKVSTNP